MRAKGIKRHGKDVAFQAVVTGVTLAITLLLLYPLYFTVIASFSEPYEVVKGNVLLWPSGFTLDAYKYMLEEKSIWSGYGNSIVYTAVSYTHPEPTRPY